MNLEFSPREPASIEETGLGETLIEQLIVKILYYRGELYGQDLSTAIGLKFSVIQDMVEALKLRHQIQIKRSLGMGNVGAVLALTETGRERAREYLEANQYAGPAPVPIEQYADVVRRQRHREGWLTKQGLAKAFRGMVLTEHVLSQVGPAVSSGNSMLIYGKPGDGKTFLVESLNNLESSAVYVPHAIECQGNIVQVFDPIYHHRVDDEEPSVSAISITPSHDRRWAKCQRPFLVSGGELSLDMLDLRYNSTSKIYEAPFQLKANNGMYLIDDFGRQRATPAEVLNRWIVPMERRIDFLSFLTGGKMTVPFETFLVFSTNLNPKDLGDEAFLRRIQYKMLMRGPAESEFIKIFEAFCVSRKLPYTRDLIQRFIDRHYRRMQKPFRRCHPRDVLSHALNLIHFEKLPMQLTDEVLDRAFASCFLEEQEEGHVADLPLLPLAMRSCADHWGDQAAQIHTSFGTMVFAAGFRDRASGRYRDPASDREFGEAETARVLERLHARSFGEWLNLGLDQQSRDLARYIAAMDLTVASMCFDFEELIERLTPPTAKPAEAQLFSHDLMQILEALSPKAPVEQPVQQPAVEARVNVA